MYFLHTFVFYFLFNNRTIAKSTLFLANFIDLQYIYIYIYISVTDPEIHLGGGGA